LGRISLMMAGSYITPERRAILLKYGLPLVILIAIILAVVITQSSNKEEGDSRFSGLNLSKPNGDYHLWINSYPEGADIYLNDSLYGTTPLQLQSVELQEYSIKLIKPTYLEFDTAIVVEDESPVFVPLLLLRKQIRIASTPRGAKIRLNDSLLSCTTPCEIQANPIDTFLLKLTTAGLEPLHVSAIDIGRDRWTVPHGQHWSVSIDSTDSILEFDGTFLREIVIDARPSGAELYLKDNDSLIGITGSPLKLPCGSNQYVLKRPPMNDMFIDLNITANSRESYMFEMHRNLSVHAFELGGSPDEDIHAEVEKVDRGISVRFLDDVTTPAALKLPGTEHRVYLSAENYADTSVIVSASQSYLRVGMRPVPEEIEVEEIPENIEPERALKANVVFYVYDDDTEEPIEGAEIIAKIRAEDRKVILGMTGEDGISAHTLEDGKYEFQVYMD